MKTIVIGLGNPYLTDDGVGVLVARQVEERLSAEALENIYVTEASVGGLRLMEMMDGYDRAILVDALLSGAAAEPGSFRKISIEELERLCTARHTSSAHDTTLPVAMSAGRAAGLKLPDDIVIFGVTVSEVGAFSENPTLEVAGAIPRVVDAVIKELEIFV